MDDDHKQEQKKQYGNNEESWIVIFSTLAMKFQSNQLKVLQQYFIKNKFHVFKASKNFPTPLIS